MYTNSTTDCRIVDQLVIDKTVLDNEYTLDGVRLYSSSALSSILVDGCEEKLSGDEYAMTAYLSCVHPPDLAYELLTIYVSEKIDSNFISEHIGRILSEKGVGVLATLGLDEPVERCFQPLYLPEVIEVVSDVQVYNGNRMRVDLEIETYIKVNY